MQKMASEFQIPRQELAPHGLFNDAHGLTAQCVEGMIDRETDKR